MPGLACYWLKRPPPGSIEPLDEYLDPARDADVEVMGPIAGPGFRAKLFLSESVPHEPRWGDFLRSGFGDAVRTAPASGSAALVILEVRHGNANHYFGVVFGFSGRHLLKAGCWERGYGLRTALNLIYPRNAENESSGRLLSIEAKTRERQTM